MYQSIALICKQQEILMRVVHMLFLILNLLNKGIFYTYNSSHSHATFYSIIIYLLLVFIKDTGGKRHTYQNFLKQT